MIFLSEKFWSEEFLVVKSFSLINLRFFKAGSPITQILKFCFA